MPAPEVIVIGAGVAGLSAAIELAAAGRPVLVLERAPTPGGKARQLAVGGTPVDAGPTVLTLPAVFDALLARAGTSLAAELTLERAGVLARHAWDAEAWLDLHGEVEASADAVGRFAGAAEARRFLAFTARARAVYAALAGPFLDAAEPSLVRLIRDTGLAGLPTLLALDPWRSMWSRLGRDFRDPRLQQLYGRYATYCGSSPFEAPATLVLVAHVEQAGVWLVGGGLHRLVRALEAAARRLGARIAYGRAVAEVAVHGARVRGVRLEDGEFLEAAEVVVASDVLGAAGGVLGPAVAGALPAVPRDRRSLSALTLAVRARVRGRSLAHHTVFFSADYRREFRELLGERRLPSAPTVYLCAQDRRADGSCVDDGAERLLIVINAPPDGDRAVLTAEAVEACVQAAWQRLAHCGTTLEVEQCVTTTPTDFEALFPGTGGALYGPATHGWRAAFRRQGATTRIQGLYVGSGSAHPGAGLPMAALSGRHAARSLLERSDSTRR